MTQNTQLNCDFFTNREYTFLTSSDKNTKFLNQSFNIWKDRMIELYRFVEWDQNNDIKTPLVEDYTYLGRNGVRIANYLFYQYGGEIPTMLLPNFAIGIPPQLTTTYYDVDTLDRKVTTFIEDMQEYLVIAEPPLQISQICGLTEQLNLKEEVETVVSSYVDINTAVTSHIESNIHPCSGELQVWESKYDKSLAEVELSCKSHQHSEYIENSYIKINIGSSSINATDFISLNFCDTPTVSIEYDNVNGILRFIRSNI